MAVLANQTLSSYGLFHTSSTLIPADTPWQAGEDVQFPQQEQEQLLPVLGLPACLCCVQRVSVSREPFPATVLGHSQWLLTFLGSRSVCWHESLRE